MHAGENRDQEESVWVRVRDLLHISWYLLSTSLQQHTAALQRQYTRLSPPRLQNTFSLVVLKRTRGIYRALLMRKQFALALPPTHHISALLLGRPQPSSILSPSIRSFHTVLRHLRNPPKQDFPEMASTDDSDFGFSSGDEADMALLTSIFGDSPATNRKHPSYPTSDYPTPKKPKTSPQKYPVTSALARKVLKQTWGYPGFRLKQEEVISRLIHGDSAVVVFPTGGGKSLVYQVPALAFDEYESEMGQTVESGLTIVISPLIALMKDQVDALRARGVEAAAIDSSQTRERVLRTYELIRRGELKLLYCAPERLNNEGFVAVVKHLRIRLIAIDEAHCISEWGQAFRPDYLKVARFVKEIGAERVLCLTATATPRVAADICAGFDVPEDGLFRTTTYRQNLELLAESFPTAKDKMPKLKSFLKDNQGATIVYVTTQQQTEDISEGLVKHGIRALPYHAGMKAEERMEVQDLFMSEKNITIVATIAFGMGIDKPDIRNIVHYDFPRSLEGYSQEIGRAGRDDLPSKCMMYLCGEDRWQRELFCRADLPSKRSVSGLLNELFTLNSGAKEGETIEMNLYRQSRDWDIKRNTLDLLYSQLELRFELLRAITPKYSNYSYSPSSDFEAATESDTSPIAEAIKAASTGRARKTVDVDSISDLTKVDREEVVRKMHEWSDRGFIELKPSGVVNRYRMLKPFPGDKVAVEELIDMAYEQMEERELSDLRRSKQVIELITSEKCFAAGLASHFGDEVSEGKCGRCQFCATGTKVDLGELKAYKVIIDEKKVQAVLEATPSRDDPRFLARIAFGIKSPRVFAERCANNRVFGSMKDCDFQALIEKFEGYCNEG